MDKLRSSIITAMKAQKHYDIQQKSEAICKLLDSYIKGDLTIGFYMAMAEEVCITPLLKKYCNQMCCAIPKIFGNGIMSFYRFEQSSQMRQNHWGIEEVFEGKEIAPEAFDMILVPLVGFDEDLHRIGHGAGYYDRYLAKTSALKIGVAFELQKCEQIRTFPHDVDMDVIVTECNIYQ